MWLCWAVLCTLFFWFIGSLISWDHAWILTMGTWTIGQRIAIIFAWLLCLFVPVTAM